MGKGGIFKSSVGRAPQAGDHWPLETSAAMVSPQLPLLSALSDFYFRSAYCRACRRFPARGFVESSQTFAEDRLPLQFLGV